MADIDALSIRISASTGVAIKNVNNLVASLQNLNSELNRIDGSRLQGIANIASSLGNVVAPMRNSGRAVSTLASNLQNIGQQAGNIARVGNAAENLSEGVQNAAQNAGEASGELGRGASQAQSLGNGMNNVSNAAHNVSRRMREVSASTKSSNGSFKGLTKELTRVSKMLKLMVTRMVLRKVIQGVIDGFKNLAQYSSTFDATLSLLWNSFRQLANSIAAAVSPLLNALAPAINYIIQLFIKAINVINQFISALTGLGTWTRAKTLTDDYAKSLDKSNKSAKALKKTVLGFDELNQLKDNNSGGGGGTDPKNMFEEVPIDPKILDFIDNMKKKVGELKKYWDAFVNGFKKGLGDDWKDKVNLIKDGALRIKDALKDIWNAPKVSQAREKYFLSLAEMLGAVAGTVARIGLNIGANLAQGIAGALESKSPEIKDYLVEMFSIGTDVNNQIEEFALAIGRISDVLVGENAISATQHFTEMFLEAYMLIGENAARLGSSLVTLITQPIIDNEGKITEALDGLFGTASTLFDFLQGAIKDIRDTLSDVWDAHLNPMFESLTGALSDLTGIILDAWNNNIQPVLDELVDNLKPLWEQYLKPLFDNIVHIIGIVGNLIAKFVQTIVVPYIGEIVNTWVPRISDALSVILSVFKFVFQTASTIIEHFVFLLRSVLQFFETGFTQGWTKACEEWESAWADHWDNMVEKLKGVANTIIEIVEKLINSIAHGINAIGEKIGDKLSNISFPSWLGGGSFSLEIPRLNDVSLPRFRNGGFPKENGLFMANSSELIGGFSNGKTAVANNEQITDGIARAVFNAMTTAQASGNARYINNTIMVDGMVLARAVTQGQKDLDRRYSPTMA